jgi:hypothetical protein
MIVLNYNVIADSPYHIFNSGDDIDFPSLNSSSTDTYNVVDAHGNVLTTHQATSIEMTYTNAELEA